jgi:hypothetical protein
VCVCVCVCSGALVHSCFGLTSGSVLRDVLHGGAQCLWVWLLLVFSLPCVLRSCSAGCVTMKPDCSATFSCS